MLETLMEECVYNEGSATGQKTNMGCDTKEGGHSATPQTAGAF